MAISYMGGMEAGFGVVASIASVILIAIATEESRGPGDRRFIAAAQIVSLVATATAIVFVVWFYLIGDENMHVLAPPGLGVMLTAFGGAIALAAATSLARNAPTISRS